MTLRRSLLLCLAVLLVAICVVLLSSSNRHQPAPPPAANVLPTATNAPLAQSDRPTFPAPPPPSEPNNPPLTLPTNAPAPASQQGDALTYDEALSFRENLQRLKLYCGTHATNQPLNQLLAPFLKPLLEHAKAHFPEIATALQESDGTPAYNNILLGCLMEADAPTTEKANIIWKIALDINQPSEVRQTATFLIGKVDTGQKHPAEFLSLLADTDPQVVLFAIQNSSSHLDQRNYDFIRTNLLNSPDVHLRLAAVHAVGSANFPDSQAQILSLSAAAPTPAAEQFSEESLVKRAAIQHLNLQTPAAVATLERIALDANEDQGVRAAAVARFDPARIPKQKNILLQLLQTLDDSTPVPFAATVDSLLGAPDPALLQSISNRVTQLSDSQFRLYIQNKLQGSSKPKNL